MKKLALFDFDNTITTKDTFTPFIYYSVPKIRLAVGKLVLFPLLMAYNLKIIPASVMRQTVSWLAFFGRSEADVKELGAAYARDVLPKFMEPNAWERIEWHRGQGDDVVVVSASLDVYLSKWCETHNLTVICTELEMKNGFLTGRYHQGDCAGEEKARRIRSAYNLDAYATIYAYGDSGEDEAMLSLAHKRFYRWKER